MPPREHLYGGYGNGMASNKVTFTLDEVSLRRLQDAAERLALPKSEVGREAIMEFHERLGRLSDRERLRMLRVFDDMVQAIPSRSASDVDRELRELRQSRSTVDAGPQRRRSDCSRHLDTDLWTLNAADFRDIPNLRLVAF